MRVLLLVASCLLLAFPALAADDPFADFRIPDHTVTSGIANASLGASHFEADDGISTSRSRTLASDLRTTLTRTHDSDALRHSLSLELIGDLNTTTVRNSFAWPTGSDLEDRFERRSSEEWFLQGSIRAYPWKAPVGASLSANLVGAYNQLAGRDDHDMVIPGDPELQIDNQRETVTGHAYQNVGTLELALGYGRVRDASVVYDVHLLEERLTEAGTLVRPLSKAAREKLAALFYVAPDYSAVHDRPGRFLWRDVERILREDGALSEQGLDAYSVLRALEGTSPVSRPARQRGWFVGPVAVGSYAHSVSRSDQRNDTYLTPGDLTYSASYSERTVLSYDAFSLGGEGEYHRPLGWRWQVDGSASVTEPVRPGERGLTTRSSGQVRWFIADRWAAGANAMQVRQYFYPRGYDSNVLVISPFYQPIDAWEASYGAFVAFYLEDRTTLSLSVSEVQQRVDLAFYRSGQVNIGVTYRFLGSLDAPGLVDPVRRVN